MLPQESSLTNVNDPVKRMEFTLMDEKIGFLSFVIRVISISPTVIPTPLKLQMEMDKKMDLHWDNKGLKSSWFLS